MFTFWGSLCQAEPCDPEKTKFQTTTERAVEEPRAKQGSAKLKLNIRMYGWKSKEKKWIQNEREGK